MVYHTRLLRSRLVQNVSFLGTDCTPKVIASIGKTIDAQLLIGLGGSIKPIVIWEQGVTHCNFIRLDHYL